LSGGDAQAAADLVNLLGADGAWELLWTSQTRDARTHRPSLHERGRYGHLEDILFDLEADSVMRGSLAEHLRLRLGMAP